MSVPRALARSATVTLAALTVALAGAAPALAGPPDPEEASASERAAATVRPALVHLTGHFVGWVQDETGLYFNGGRPYEQTGTCTGFGVHPDGYVATAGHCVDTASDSAIGARFIEAAAQEAVANTPGLALEDAIAYGLANWTVVGRTAGSPIEAQLVVEGAPTGSPDDAGLPARIVEVRPFPDGDVALLKVEARNLPVLELSTASEIPVGTPLLSAGYPGNVGQLLGPGVEPSIKDGEVSGRQTVGGSVVYEISAPMTNGMSGGPAIDMNGQVVGINSFGPAAGGGSFAFIGAATGLAELMSRNGVRNELGPLDRAYREGIDAYYTGHYSDAISAFDRVLQEVPTHAQAARLRADASAARDQFGDPGLPPVAYWAIAGGAVALGSGVGVLVAVRRRRRRAAMAEVPQQRLAGWPPFPGQPAGYGWPGGPSAHGAPFPGPMAGPRPQAQPFPMPLGAHRPFPGAAAGWQPRPGDGTTTRIVRPGPSHSDEPHTARASEERPPVPAEPSHDGSSSL
jgi:serine protease Do